MLTLACTPVSEKPKEVTTRGLVAARLVLTPATTYGGAPVTGTVTLSAAAPWKGLTLKLASSNPTLAQVPQSVTIAAFQTQGTFQIATAPVGTATSVEISASGPGVGATASLALMNPLLSEVRVDPSSVYGGTQVTGVISFTGVAPAMGLLVSVASNNPNLVPVPPSVTVPAGQSNVAFPISTARTTTTSTITISASTNGGQTKTALLMIKGQSTTIGAVRGPDPGITERFLGIFECKNLPPALTSYVNDTSCEAVKADLRVRLAGYAVDGSASPEQRLGMFLSLNCDLAADFRIIVNNVIKTTVTSRLGLTSAAFSDYVVSVLNSAWDMYSTVRVPITGNYEALLVAPTSATVVTAAAPAGTVCSNSVRLR
jgi:hypothetical protein